MKRRSLLLAFSALLLLTACQSEGQKTEKKADKSSEKTIEKNKDTSKESRQTKTTKKENAQKKSLKSQRPKEEVLKYMVPGTFYGEPYEYHSSPMPALKFDTLGGFQLSISMDIKIEGTYEVKKDMCILECYKNRPALKESEYDTIALKIVSDRELVLQKELPEFVKKGCRFKMDDEETAYTRWSDKDIKDALPTAQQARKEHNKYAEINMQLGKVVYQIDPAFIESTVDLGYERDKLMTFAAWFENDEKKEPASWKCILYKKDSNSKWKFVSEGF